MSDPWTLSRDGSSVMTSKNAVVRGNLTATNAMVKGDLTVKNTLEIGDLAVANAVVNGDLTVAGTISGTVVVDTVHVSQITGLLGDSFSLQFPDVIDNLATVEISGIETTGPMVIITGPGYDIERMPGFDAVGRPSDQAGFAMAHPFIFEASGADVSALKNYFDQYLASPADGGRSLSLIVKWLDQSEAFRWNFIDFVPQSYDPSVDGRTRFRWVPHYPPDADMRYTSLRIQPSTDDPSWPGQQQGSSFNPETDKLVEIEGVTRGGFYPQVECDEINRTLTLNYGFGEELPGVVIYNWVKSTIENGELDAGNKKSIAVIEQENGVEVGRKRYFECFPIKYEQFAGFGLPGKLKASAVISFGWWEQG